MLDLHLLGCDVEQLDDVIAHEAHDRLVEDDLDQQERGPQHETGESRNGEHARLIARAQSVGRGDKEGADREPEHRRRLGQARFGVADKLKAVSADLDALPDSFVKYLTPSGGTYNCRVIAGTTRPSVHGNGAAIDINVAWSDYWRNHQPVGGKHPYKNRIPWEIVEIFERHGFIGGGKWYHYDTMHFEYRPELLAP